MAADEQLRAQLPAILADIGQRLAQLENTPPPANEALQPTYQQVNPDGTVGGLFIGGVETFAGTETAETFPSANLAAGHRWISSGGSGALLADIEGYSTSVPLGHPVPSVLRLAAAPGLANEASLRLQGHSDAGQNRVEVIVAGLTRRLLGDDGGSDYLQLRPRGSIALGMGVVGTAPPGVFAVAHGMGVTPTGVICAPWNSGGGVTNSIFTVSALTSTTFTVNNSTGTTSMFWVAWATV